MSKLPNLGTPEASQENSYIKTIREYLIMCAQMRANNHPSKTEDWKYKSYEEIILTHGQSFKGDKRPQKFEKQADKACYQNSAQFVLDARNNKGYRYVEGYAIAPSLGIPIEHAWIIDKDSLVIDLTWKDPEECFYFGVVVDTEELRENILKTQQWGFFCNDYMNQGQLLRKGFKTLHTNEAPLIPTLTTSGIEL